MAFERFTEACRDVVGRAVREAEQHHSEHLTDEHLLLGLLAGGGVVTEVLGKYGVTHEDVSARLRRAGAS